MVNAQNVRMKKYHIILTTVEKSLFEAINLRGLHRTHDEAHAAYLANRRPILALQSLFDRTAIPTERLSYWNDPVYDSGYRFEASHRDLFERNSRVGEEIYTRLPGGIHIAFDALQPATTAHAHD